MEAHVPGDGELQALPGRSRIYVLGIISTLFFMWGFCTVLNDVLVPHLKAVFEMSYVQTMLIQFTFFGTYFLLSMPSAKLLEWIGYRYAIVTGLTLMGIGCLIFLPAASVPSYNLFLAALFVLGAGITVLQVAANPYVVGLGPRRTGSARLNLAQGFNSLGTLLAPLFGGVLILSQTRAGGGQLLETLGQRLADARSVQVPYLGIAIVLIAIAAIFNLLRMPDAPMRVPRDAAATGSLWRNKTLVMGGIAIFVYVGAEVSIGSFLINYMVSPHISTMTTAEAANKLPFYWGGAMVGRFLIGAIMMRYATPSKVLADNAVIATVLLGVSIVAQGAIAMWAVLLVGLCNSIMFPTIFALSIRKLGPLTERGAGILVTAIFGGAVIPMVQAAVADHLGLTLSFAVPALCYCYIWLFAKHVVTGMAEPDNAPLGGRI